MMNRHFRIWTWSTLAILTVICSASAATPGIRFTASRHTLWISPTASHEAVSSREGVRNTVEQAKRAGFDAIILYVKELNGHVIYPSRIAPRLLEYKGISFPADFDPLAAYIEEAHKQGMRLHAGFETFTEGNKVFPGVGVGYTKHKEWQTVAYDLDTADGKVKRAPWGEFKQGIPLFVNAALPAVQDYELSIVQEVLNRYKVDAVVFDRARWQGINSDFSDYSRDLFRRYVKDKGLRWPEDVYEITPDSSGKKKIVEGKYYRQWLEWRSYVIQGYFKRLSKLVRTSRPGIGLEVYVGSWYPVYHELGVNWGSTKYHVPYEWATANYGKTGYADLLDTVYVGLYYPYVTEEEAAKAGAARWRSVEGAARLAREVTAGVVSVRGVINYGDDHLSDEALDRAAEVTIKETGGASVFEASHVTRRAQWAPLEKLLIRTAAEGKAGQ